MNTLWAVGMEHQHTGLHEIFHFIQMTCVATSSLKNVMIRHCSLYFVTLRYLFLVTKTMECSAAL